MKKFICTIIITIIIMSCNILSAEEKKVFLKEDYENFILLLDSIYKNGFDKPERSLYKEIVKSFYNFIESAPENQWSIAAFFQIAKIINGFQFDRDITFEEILSLTKNFQFSTEYSKTIFNQVLFKTVCGNSTKDYSMIELQRLYKECVNAKYKPYINYLIREYSEDLKNEEKDKLMNEILNEESYKQTLFYPEALKYKIAKFFSEKKTDEALKISLEMTSESFYKDKPWKDAYFVKNGLFESSFLAIIGAYVDLKNIDKAKAYLKIAKKKFSYNFDLKYYIEEVSLLEAKKR